MARRICDVCRQMIPIGDRSTKRCGPPRECWIKAKNLAAAKYHAKQRRGA